MKRILFFVALILSLPALAQKQKTVRPTPTVSAAFEKAHPGIKGAWEREGKNYEVEFTKDGKQMSCVINSRGTIIETETQIRPDDLPAQVRSYLGQHYKGQKIKDAARIEKANGIVQFEAGIDKKDILFDANGTFIKEAKD